MSLKFKILLTHTLFFLLKFKSLKHPDIWHIFCYISISSKMFSVKIEIPLFKLLLLFYISRKKIERILLFIL